MNFGKWIVFSISKNVEGGVATEAEKKNTEKEARDYFYYKCDKVGTNPSTALLKVMLINPFGDIEKEETIDNTQYVAE